MKSTCGLDSYDQKFLNCNINIIFFVAVFKSDIVSIFVSASNYLNFCSFWMMFLKIFLLYYFFLFSFSQFSFSLLVHRLSLKIFDLKNFSICIIFWIFSIRFIFIFFNSERLEFQVFVEWNTINFFNCIQKSFSFWLSLFFSLFCKSQIKKNSFKFSECFFFH